MMNRDKSRLFNIRAASNIDKKRRAELLFEEVEELQGEVKKRIKRNSRWSTIFRISNTFLGLIIILSSAIIVILEAVRDEDLNGIGVAILVLGGLIFIITGASELTNLSQRGYHYRQGTIRLRRIFGQVRDLIYLFHNFQIEEVLAFINTYRAEIDEIDLDLYKSSMSGDVKSFGNEIKIENSTFERERNNSDIHIIVESEESPKTSPKSSPNLGHKNLHKVSSKNSPVMIRIETGKSEEN
jgi:hypothetical protein